MKPEIVEELARAIAIEDGTSPDEPVAPYDKRLGWELYKSSVRALAPIIDSLVSGAREEGWRDGIEEAADMADRWNVGIGEAIRNMKGPDHA